MGQEHRLPYSGLQLTSFDSATLSYIIRNAAKARTKGVEASVEWRPVRGLSVHVNTGYNRARYINFPAAPCYGGQTSAQGCVGGVQDLAGHRLERAPEWSTLFGAEYEVALGGDLQLLLSADGDCKSKYVAMLAEAPQSVIGSYCKFGASARVSSAKDGWNLSVIGRNLGDKYKPDLVSNMTFAAPDQLAAQTGRGRTISVQLGYNF